jgi:hypothetical protein
LAVTPQGALLRFKGLDMRVVTRLVLAKAKIFSPAVACSGLNVQTVRERKERRAGLDTRMRRARVVATLHQGILASDSNRKVAAVTLVGVEPAFVAGSTGILGKIFGRRIHFALPIGNGGAVTVREALVVVQLGAQVFTGPVILGDGIHFAMNFHVVGVISAHDHVVAIGTLADWFVCRKSRTQESILARIEVRDVEKVELNQGGVPAMKDTRKVRTG